MLRAANSEIVPELQRSQEPGRKAPRYFRLRLGPATLESLGVSPPATSAPPAAPATPAPKRGR